MSCTKDGIYTRFNSTTGILPVTPMPKHSRLVWLFIITFTSPLLWGLTISTPSQLLGLTYDYIIVGGGTAGLTLATRLSENLTATVLVLEAGVTNSGQLLTEVPFLAPQATPNTELDWNFTVVPQRGLDNRTFSLPAGRVLGGSSSVNYLVHQYGTNDDWNKMARIVNDSRWNWTNMQQFVARHEKLVPPLDGHNTTGQIIPDLHSTTGVLPVSLPGQNQTTDAVIISTTEQLAEFPFNEDTSGLSPSILGFGFAQSAISGGVRTTSSTAYLSPINNVRLNLTVLINATAIKLVQTGTNGDLPSFRAVQFASNPASPVTTVKANKMVILCAGAIKTPQLLMLSGIGNAADLEALNITTIINNTSVGQNYVDSTLIPNFFSVNSVPGTLDPVMQNQTLFSALLSQWMTSRTGLFTNGLVNMLGYARLPSTASIFSIASDPSAGPTSPHYEIIPTDYFLSTFISPPITPPTSGNFITFVTTLSSPTSRGTIQLQSSNPFDPPLIDPEFLTTDFDIFTMRESVRAVQRLVAAPAWAQFNVTPFPPNVPASATNSSVDGFVRKSCGTIFHPGGSAAMSSATDGLGQGVVNPDLTVKGADGLRIVDASIWPRLPSLHPAGAIYILAEQAADIIKAAG